jgi:hypothetical protein
MAEDYGHFADRSRGPIAFQRTIRPYSRFNQLTPSFFCRLEDEVVYWNTRRLSG